MSPEEYIDSEINKFEELCKEIKYTSELKYSLEYAGQLDDARDCAIKEKWPEGTPQELGNSIAIQWGAAFSKMVAGSYKSKWSVNPKTKTPIVIVKCGAMANQVQALLLGAQAFNDGTLFADLAAELATHLTNEGAEEI